MSLLVRPGDHLIITAGQNDNDRQTLHDTIAAAMPGVHITILWSPYGLTEVLAHYRPDPTGADKHTVTTVVTGNPDDGQVKQAVRDEVARLARIQPGNTL